jgi:soluble lytic murein transglycosylase
LSRPAELQRAIDLASRCGRLDAAVRAARTATRDGPVPSAASFPLPDLDELVRPQGNDPEPALVLAVTRQESQFHQHAVSSAGALGLMQLMPATARTVARGLGLPFSRERLLNNPGYNIALGRDYLRDQIQSFGEVAMAVAAYNAGPSRVRDWLERYGDPRGKGTEAMLDWLELIPFAETRNYVQRVLEGRNVYRMLLPEAKLRGAARPHPFAPFGQARPPT